MDLQVGVKILLKNSEGRYLLLRRSLEKYPETKGEEWDIVGGRIDPGVSLLENLRREVREESGLELAVTPELKAAQDILLYKGRHVIRLSYVGMADGEVRLDDEHVEYQWYPAAELRILTNVNRYFKELLDKGVLGI